MPEWPQEIPDDLRKALEALEAYRSAPSSAERWDVIREWLIEKKVEAPGNLPRRKEITNWD